MNDVGYMVAAYVGAAILYGTYVTWLLTKERRLERATDGRRPR